MHFLKPTIKGDVKNTLYIRGIWNISKFPQYITKFLKRPNAYADSS